MIFRKEKLEEYREIKPFWTKRLTNHLPMWETGLVKLKNGYGNNRPTLICKVVMGKRLGKEEWGADPDINYYIIKIIEILEVRNYEVRK